MTTAAKFLFDEDFSAGQKPTITLVEAERRRADAESVAYRNGFAAGQAQAQNDIAQRTAAALDVIADAIERLNKSLVDVETRLETEAVHVAVAVAGKLAPELIAREPLAEISALATESLSRGTRQPPDFQQAQLTGRFGSLTAAGEYGSLNASNTTAGFDAIPFPSKTNVSLTSVGSLASATYTVLDPKGTIVTFSNATCFCRNDENGCGFMASVMFFSPSKSLMPDASWTMMQRGLVCSGAIRATTCASSARASKRPSALAMPNSIWPLSTCGTTGAEGPPLTISTSSPASR